MSSPSDPTGNLCHQFPQTVVATQEQKHCDDDAGGGVVVVEYQCRLLGVLAAYCLQLFVAKQKRLQFV